MTLAITHSRATVGIDAPRITIETHLANGLPAFHVVGLPAKAVQESRERVRGALVNSGFEFPQRRITVSLAPADLPKEGARFDLAIALGILAASGQLRLPANAGQTWEAVGELSLSGDIRPVPGILPAALAARGAARELLLSPGNLAEASLVGETRLIAAADLLTACRHLSGAQPLEPGRLTPAPADADDPDLADVRGQAHAKRALEIAAAGGHHLLMSGPPGAGKSMLARRLPGLLPPLDEQQALQAAAIRSVSDETYTTAWRRPPFRAPHHTCSGVALVGGGNPPKPGEISLAHHGVLFLDELPEFNRGALEALREPIENGCVTISRASRRASYPARFQLVAAMNPCRCGHLGDPLLACGVCTGEQVWRYQSRVSGPLLDRIDLHVHVPAQPPGTLLAAPSETATSAVVARRVASARQRQQRRQGCLNSQLGADALSRHCGLDAAGHTLLADAAARLGLSARALHRVLRVARSIADLSGGDTVATTALSEALGYRSRMTRPGDCGQT